MHDYLQPASFIDSAHPAVIAFAERWRGTGSPREQAVALYLAVRDQIRYNPYSFSAERETLKASHALQTGESYCVPKALLLAACARHCGIPARIGLADVRNHLSTERMRQTMKTDVFAWHGYTDLWLDGAWRKATPAFNLSLCDKFGLLPLDFDGVNDSIYHPFDQHGNRHMEYLLDRGKFDDLPLAAMLETFHTLYGEWMPGTQTQSALGQQDFLADVEREVAGGAAPQA